MAWPSVALLLSGPSGCLAAELGDRAGLVDRVGWRIGTVALGRLGTWSGSSNVIYVVDDVGWWGAFVYGDPIPPSTVLRTRTKPHRKEQGSPRQCGFS